LGEEIHVDGLRSSLPNGGELGARLIRAQQRASPPAETAGFCHGDRQRRSAGPRHGRQNDRQFDPEKVQETVVGHAYHLFLRVAQIDSGASLTSDRRGAAIDAATPGLRELNSPIGLRR
jgi:hypothetical protein